MGKKSITLDDSIAKKIDPILLAYREDIRRSIETRIKTSVPKIDKHEITGVLRYQGQGGTTYILQANFHSGIRKIKGGIVVKYANDIQRDIENAKMLEKVLRKRQQWWDEVDQSKFKKYPKTVFSPKVLGVHEKTKVVILEFMPNVTPLMEAKFPDSNEVYHMMGYALGRLHGNKSQKTNMALYKPVFKLLKEHNAIKDSLGEWEKQISNSKGGVDVLHGDSHLQNILYSKPDSLAWIDAILTPGGERMDDVGYSISHILQEIVIKMVEEDPNRSTRDIMKKGLRDAIRITPRILTVYLKVCSATQLYPDLVPIDFFIGAHLIIRSQMFTDNEKIRNVLQVLGEQFINSKFINHLLKG